MEIIITRLDGTCCSVTITEEDVEDRLAMVTVGDAKVFIGFSEHLQQWRELTDVALGEAFADAW